MRITFLGGADEVGASSLLLEIAGRRLLVDAGIRPSPKARWGLAGDQLPDLSQIDRSGGIDAILVTHAHTDHTGALELVCERYPSVPVYATPVTIALTRVLHQDARRIMRARLEEEGELPLFDDVAVARLMAAFVPVALHTPLPLAPGLTATYFPAGHIAGAAMIGLTSDEGRLLISGDISISPQRTVDGARPPAFSPDILILESTYGGRLHANRHVEERRLVETVSTITADGGKVLIPAFALGRAQEVLLTLAEFQRRGELAAIPIWADGMVRAVCQAYSSFPEALPLALQEQGAAFFTEQIRPVETTAQRNALIWDAGPAVIVSSSGMLAGGPSLSYARSLAGQPQHAILLTGYQDEESPGRRLQEIATRGQGTLRLGKDKVDVQCHLATYSLSAHADEGQLVSFVETLDPSRVFLVHGDEGARGSLAKALRARGRAVQLPRAGQAFDLTYAPVSLQRTPRGIGRGQSPDLRRMWESAVASQPTEPEDAGAGLVTLDELAQIWWGDRPGPTGSQLAILAEALAQDERYFVADRARPDVYRVRTRATVDLAARRRKQMADFGALDAQWLLVHRPDGATMVARVVTAAADHVLVDALIDAGNAAGNAADEDDDEDDDAQLIVWPEEILSILAGASETAPATTRMAASLRADLRGAVMEPNQALAFANQCFPPAARLRRGGYRLADHVLVLTFDFPEVAQTDYRAELDNLEIATGWQIEVMPEANQGALNSLIGECLPSQWRVTKGPSIFRQEKRVSVTVVSPDAVDQDTLAAAKHAYRTISGFQLDVTIDTLVATAPLSARVMAGTKLEINAAYAAIKATLAGSGLYRTSLKGEEIVLSFISPQVGARHATTIADLAKQIGWPLSVNPQPNQGAITDAARRLLQGQNWTVVKGPSIYLDRAEVVVTLAAVPPTEAWELVQTAFATETGYRILLNRSAPSQTASSPSTPSALPQPGAPRSPAVVEVSLAQVRLPSSQQSQQLAPEKLEKAIERVRRLGQVSPPITVRRLRDGYLLLNGLYRLRAAQALGHTRIPATIEA